MNEREDLLNAEQAMGRARRLEHGGLMNLAEDAIQQGIAETALGSTAHNKLMIRLAQLHVSLRDPTYAYITLKDAKEDSDPYRIVSNEVEMLLEGADPNSIATLLDTLNADDPATIKATRIQLKPLLSVRLSHLKSAHLWRKELLTKWNISRPGDPFATWHLARATYALDEFDAAELLLIDLTARFPERRGILNLLGRSQFKNGKCKDSIVTWQRSIGLDNGQPAIHFALGRALLHAACRE